LCDEKRTEGEKGPPFGQLLARVPKKPPHLLERERGLIMKERPKKGSWKG